MPRFLENQDLVGLSINLNLKESERAAKMKKCPICGEEFDARYPAISRKDNKTEICSKCGQVEAIDDFIKHFRKDYNEAETILKVNDKVKFNKDGQDIEATISEIKPNSDDITVKDANNQSYTVNKGALSLVVNEAKLCEDEMIWSNTGEEDAIDSMSHDELIDYAKWAYGDDYDFNGKSFDDATKEELYEFLMSDMDFYEMTAEDYEESIKPMVEKQCEDDILVLFGQAANWRGSGQACQVIDTDELRHYLMPDYDAHIVLMKDNNNNLYYTESNHDTPAGGTKMYLYSFKDSQAIEDAKKKLEEIFDDGEEVNMYYFDSIVGYEELKALIDEGILTNVEVNW